MSTAAQSWYSISVTVTPEAAEAIEYAFNSLDALGTEINHLRKKNAADVTVVGYFNDLPDEERVQDELQYALLAYGLDNEAVLNTERQRIEDADWLSEWKKHWSPTEIGSFIIAPPWSEVSDDGRIVIRIEPNMAFGTGTHETTQLCVEAIENNYQPGDSFLDVGTGTGILAIAAALLNFKSQISNFKLVGVDTDVDSITIAKENAKMNGVGEAIDFSVGSIDASTPKFDFVCANLTLDVIEPILSLLINSTKKTLVLSGILAEQSSEISAALRASGVDEFEINQAGEWIRVVASF
jgi:ribosomal protein L11 methyltransferase